MGRLIHTGLGSSSLIAHVLNSPPPPREQLCNRSCSIKTHTKIPHKRASSGLLLKVWFDSARPPSPLWLGSDSFSAWWLGLAPATLEFWVRSPNERNQGKQARPVLKYRVPHGSHYTGLGSSSLVPHVLHSLSPPREQLCNRSCSNKTHKPFHRWLVILYFFGSLQIKTSIIIIIWP